MDRNRIALSMKKDVGPEEKKPPKKTRSGKPNHSHRGPKSEKRRPATKKPEFQGPLAEALLKSGLK
jgi:hypothetical protein